MQALLTALRDPRVVPRGIHRASAGHGRASWKRAALALALAVSGAGAAAAAAGCPEPGADIVTDRPDVTNSSLVVPTGSFQGENGVNLSARDGAHLLDGTNTRFRLGLFPCAEVLVDLPSYVARLSGTAASGFTDVAPAVKWQLGPLPGDIDLAVTAGIGLPSGMTRLGGRGVLPYLQLPWSREIGGGWGVSGMVTEFFAPSQPTKHVAEGTFVLEREVGEHADLFVEYVGDYPDHREPSHMLNSGGAYRLTPTQQIDFHAAIGLNRNAPSYVFGVGYSIRFDRLF
jgi:hypothetical protein